MILVHKGEGHERLFRVGLLRCPGLPAVSAMDDSAIMADCPAVLSGKIDVIERPASPAVYIRPGLAGIFGTQNAAVIPYGDKGISGYVIHIENFIRPGQERCTPRRWLLSVAPCQAQ